MGQRQTWRNFTKPKTQILAKIGSCLYLALQIGEDVRIVPHTRMGMKGRPAGVAHRSGGLMPERKGYGGAPMVDRRGSRPVSFSLPWRSSWVAACSRRRAVPDTVVLGALPHADQASRQCRGSVHHGEARGDGRRRTGSGTGNGWEKWNIYYYY
jgi:hypothetical protein